MRDICYKIFHEYRGHCVWYFVHLYYYHLPGFTGQWWYSHSYQKIIKTRKIIWLCNSQCPIIQSDGCKISSTRDSTWIKIQNETMMTFCCFLLKKYLLIFEFLCQPFLHSISVPLSKYSSESMNIITSFTDLSSYSEASATDA